MGIITSRVENLRLVLNGFFNAMSSASFVEAAEQLLEGVLQIYRADGASLQLHPMDRSSEPLAICLGCVTWLEAEQKCAWDPSVRSLLSQPVRYRRQQIGEMTLAKLDVENYFRGDIATELETFVGYLGPVLASELLLSVHRSLEEQLVQSQKMEAVGTLAGGIAHDFNNLLTTILGNCEMMRQELEPDSRLIGFLDDVKKAAERSASLTRQLLAFSRKQTLAPKPLDLNQRVRNIHSLLLRVLPEKVQLTMALESSLGRVKADPTQIEQVIINLAVNARDAMPNGGTLTIATANIEQAQQDTADHRRRVMLSVSDTGHGMTLATQSRIFEPFFTTKGVGQGTGLGLSVVYGIVKQSGGEIEVNSTPGLGTTFRVFLPRIDEDLEAEELGDSGLLSAAEGSETVLVVEDDAAVRAVIVKSLRGKGYNVLETGDPREALLITRQYQERIHLLLTDLMMPSMNGTDVAAQMERARPQIKVLYVSGYDAEARSEGPFLQKPFVPKVLLAKVREVLDAPLSNPRYGRNTADSERSKTADRLKRQNGRRD